MEYIKVLWRRYREFVLYAIIGGLSAAIDFGVYTLLVVGSFMPYLWANVISVHCGIFCSFILNRQFNFKVKDKTGKRFLLFYMVGLSGLALSELLIFLSAQKLGFDYLLSKLFTIVVVAIYQFLLNKYVSFKKSKNG